MREQREQRASGWFHPAELEARIRAVLRRVPSRMESLRPSKPTIRVGDLSIDLDEGWIVNKDTRIKLTTTERRILEVLIAAAGEPLSRPEIYAQVWGFVPIREIDTRGVDVNVRRVRQKLEADPSIPPLILTKRGFGYMFANIRPP